MTTYTYAAPEAAYQQAGYQATPAAPYAAAPQDPYAQYAQAPAYAAAQPAYAQPGYAPPYGYSNPDEVRTVFITGFPPDVKERELNNLLRFLPGYEASQMHIKGGMAQGFALFENGAAAAAAMRAVQTLVFDDGAVLRAEMARKNMYIKDEAATKRSRYDYGGGNYYAPAAVASPSPGAVPPVQPRGYVPVSNTKDNPPCNTLFIGNLSDQVDETELRGLFAHQPGFAQIKLNRGQRGVTCFVEFVDVASAMAVHQQQQGAVLASSDRGGIRIQYSKNPYGKKRDFGGNYVSPTGFSPLQPAPLDAAYPAQDPAYPLQQPDPAYAQQQAGVPLEQGGPDEAQPIDTNGAAPTPLDTEVEAAPGV